MSKTHVRHDLIVMFYHVLVQIFEELKLEMSTYVYLPNLTMRRASVYLGKFSWSVSNSFQLIQLTRL